MHCWDTVLFLKSPRGNYGQIRLSQISISKLCSNNLAVAMMYLNHRVENKIQGFLPRMFRKSSLHSITPIIPTSCCSKKKSSRVSSAPITFILPVISLSLMPSKSCSPKFKYMSRIMHFHSLCQLD